MNTDRCPEYCGHPGECAEQAEAISRAEREAELANERFFERGYPGYDFDPNDPQATGW